MKILYYAAPLCARKGQPHFLNEIRAIFGGFLPFWTGSKVRRKPNALLNTPYRNIFTNDTTAAIALNTAASIAILATDNEVFITS